MLHALHEMLDTGHVIPAYGLNLGTVGFLMNKPKSSRLLAERIARAKQLTITPLAMTATLGSGNQVTRLAINEVSLLRETRQTARLEVSVNGKVRMAELYCDGVLVATPAGRLDAFAGEQLGQADAIEQLHRVVQGPVLGAAVVEHPDRVGVRQRRRRRVSP